MMKKLVVLLLLITACPILWAKPTYVATIQPVKMLLKEIVGDKANVVVLLSPSSSPHTYEPKPTDIKKTAQAAALFFVGDHLDDWSAKMTVKTKIALMSFVKPNQKLPFSENHGHHGSIDPHFWTDPITVISAVKGLNVKLNSLDPANAKTYNINTANFIVQLKQLDAKVAKILAPVKGKAVFLFHPSFNYLLKRYGLVLGGVVEPFPGKEPSPKYIKQLMKDMRSYKSNAVFTEPQLPPRPAEVLAEAVGARLYTLDPNGGVAGRDTYSALILFNAQTLAKALK